MTDQPRTICKNCKHRLVKNDNGVWYNYKCGHPSGRREEAVDPVSGKRGYIENGIVSMSNNKWPYCRDINWNGECDLYEQSNTDWFLRNWHASLAALGFTGENRD